MTELEKFADRKRLPIAFLTQNGVEEAEAGIRFMNGAARARIRARANSHKTFWDRGDNRPMRVYAYDRVERMAQRSNTLLVVEGESCTLSAWLHQRAALGVPGSTMVQTLELEDVMPFDRVVVIREPDEAGHKFPNNVAKRLRKLGYLGCIDVADLPTKDLSDLHVQYAHDKPGFNRALDAAISAAQPAVVTAENRSIPDTASSLSVVRADDPSVAVRRVDWLEPDRIPFGVLTLLQGNGGVGKTTTITCAIAAWSKGQRFFSPSNIEPVTTLIVAEEDGLGIYKARLRVIGADLSRIVFAQGLAFGDGIEPFAIPDHVAQLSNALAHTGARVVYIDALHSHLNLEGEGRMPQQTRRAVRPLLEMAAAHGTALLATRHYSKSRTDAASRGLGSIELRNMARSVLDFGPNPENEGSRIVAVSKANFSRIAPSLTFRVEQIHTTDDMGEPMIVTKAVIEGVAANITADDLAMRQPTEPETRHAVKDWLGDYLADGDWHSREAIVRAANQARITQATLYRARGELGVDAEQRGFPAKAHWRLGGARLISGDPGLSIHEDVINQAPADKPGPMLSDRGKLCRRCKTLDRAFDCGDGTWLCPACADSAV